MGLVYSIVASNFLLQDKTKYVQARQMLEGASRELQQADGLLRRASMTATMGVIGDMGPGHGRLYVVFITPPILILILN